MDRFANLYKRIGGAARVEEELKIYFDYHIDIIEVNKGHVLLKRGDVCRYLYYIESGLVQIYSDKYDKEITTWLLKEDNFTISVESFLKQIPSEETIVTQEKTTLLRMSFEALEEGCRRYAQLAEIRKNELGYYYAKKEETNRWLNGLDALDRYLHLLKHDPQLTQRVPLPILASYLRMSLDTLKDIRGKLSNG